MYKGELAEHTEEYQWGHSKGVERGYGDAINKLEFKIPLKMFAGVTEKQKKETRQALIFLMDSYYRGFVNLCDTYGMGLDEEQEETAADE